HVAVENDAISVQDNGGGLPAGGIGKTLDYSVRVSDKANHVSPTRGQMGNAPKGIWGAAFLAHEGQSAPLEGVACGGSHRIDVTLDHIGQKPQLDHVETAGAIVTNGTFLKMHWPRIASYLGGAKTAGFYNDDEEEGGEAETAPWDSAVLLLNAFSSVNP